MNDPRPTRTDLEEQHNEDRAEIEAAGGELLGEITRVEELGYAYRRSADLTGVYGLDEQRREAR